MVGDPEFDLGLTIPKSEAVSSIQTSPRETMREAPVFASLKLASDPCGLYETLS